MVRDGGSSREIWVAYPGLNVGDYVIEDIGKSSRGPGPSRIYRITGDAPDPSNDGFDYYAELIGEGFITEMGES